MTIIYKPRPYLFIADWLSRQNHSEDKDAKLLGMQLCIIAIQTTTNIQECMIIHELEQVTCQEQHMQCLKGYIIKGWPEHKNEIQQDIRPYWTFKDDIAITDRGHHERKAYSSASGIMTTDTPIATYQSHGY